MGCRDEDRVRKLRHKLLHEADFGAGYEGYSSSLYPVIKVDYEGLRH